MNRLVAIVLFGFAVAPAIAQASCTIYEHRDYGGAEYELAHHTRMLMEDGESIGCQVSDQSSCEVIIRDAAWDDAISSFKVMRGCTLILWEDIDDEDDKFVATKSRRYIGDDWNDEVSELLCMCEE